MGEANWDFHRSLYRASQWTRGLRIAENLHASVAPYVELYTMGLGWTARSPQQHADLLDLCRERKVRPAVDLLKKHLEQAGSVLLTHLKDEG